MSNPTIKAKLQQYFLLMLSMLVLTGCGSGASGDNEVTTNPTIGARLAMDVVDSSGNTVNSVEATTTVIVRVKATNDFGRSVSGVAITFNTDLGTLSQSSALTGSDGYASVNLVTTNSDLGVASLTADGTVDGTALTSSGQVEFTSVTTQAPPTLTLTTYDQQCQQQTNETTAGNTLCVKAEYKSQGVPLVNEIVSFTATLGTVAPSSALTDDTGTATVFISSDSTQRGAGELTATAGTTTDTLNYQFVAGQVSVDLTLETYEADCVTQRDSFAAGITLCLRAVLLDGDQPLQSQIVTFAMPLGTLRQTSALTNADGIATVLADSTQELLGAATATATFDTVSATSNYEYIESDSTPTTGPQVQLATLQNNVFNNRFKAGEPTQLQATVLNGDGTAISNAIVDFTAERGNLTTDSALTNNEGIAQVTLTGTTDNIGAAVATARTTIEGVVFTQSFNYEVLAADAIDGESIFIGHFDDNGVFQDGLIGATIPRLQNGAIPLSAGGTVGLNVVVVNQSFQRITTPTAVTFSSACESNQSTNLDTQVTTINGEARSTYEDLSCATVNGNQDILVATILVNNVSITANATIELQPESVGSIEFISAEPTNIVLQGTGGQGKQETSTLTYQVKGVLGNPLTQQEVTFSLDSGVGDLSISPLTSLTNSQGLVSTKVTSGNVPAAVRVTASTIVKINGEPDKEISTQSDLLSVNTGLPDQNSITLGTSLLNPEANSFNGRVVDITAFMADSFNNPVPDGTTISFTTEGGFITPSCNTVNGSCTVVWTGANPRVANHRITILASAIGHETFFDVNGNNVFDNEDGGALSQGTDSGFGRGSYQSSGFVDHSEAWRDDNENRIHDAGEVFIDFDNDNQFDGADSKFNGPQCIHDTLCADELHSKINVRKALVMIMSGSQVRYSLLTGDRNPGTNSQLAHIGSRHVIATNDSANSVAVDGFLEVTASGTAISSSDLIIIDDGLSLPMQLVIADDAQGLGQILPAGTQVNISTSAGALAGTTSFTVPNSIGYINATGVDEYGGNEIEFSLVNVFSPNTTEDDEGLLTVSFTFPDSRNTFSFSIPVFMRNTGN